MKKIIILTVLITFTHAFSEWYESVNDRQVLKTESRLLTNNNTVYLGLRHNLDKRLPVSILAGTKGPFSSTFDLSEAYFVTNILVKQETIAIKPERNGTHYYLAIFMDRYKGRTNYYWKPVQGSVNVNWVQSKEEDEIINPEETSVVTNTVLVSDNQASLEENKSRLEQEKLNEQRRLALLEDKVKISKILSDIRAFNEDIENKFKNVSKAELTDVLALMVDYVRVTGQIENLMMEYLIEGSNPQLMLEVSMEYTVLQERLIKYYRLFLDNVPVD